LKGNEYNLNKSYGRLPLDTKIPSSLKENNHVRIRGSMKTDLGSERDINQDSMLTLHFTLNECSRFKQLCLFIVADGMGGGADGEVASSIAIRSVASYITDTILESKSISSLDISIISKAVQKANMDIISYSSQDSSREGMGSTITVGLLIGNKLFIGHVGDTRAYIINNETVRQVTEDHSLVTRLLKMGQLTPEQAKNYPHKNLIYRTLGGNERLEVATYEETLGMGDICLICCDGLWDYFPCEELQEILTTSSSFDEAADLFIDLANERGGKDNITVVTFQLLSV